jgi:hypothetical protein
MGEREGQAGEREGQAGEREGQAREGRGRDWQALETSARERLAGLRDRHWHARVKDRQAADGGTR